MKNDTLLRSKAQRPFYIDETLKVTSLLYFKDALEKEQYENCAELAQTAKAYGAQQDEIKQIIDDFVRGVKKVRQNEANKNDQNRRF